MSSTYSDVDSSDDPEGAVAWLERIDQWPQIRAYKRRMLELLGPRTRALDVGSGPGADVIEVGMERCIGVDRSRVMCRVAAARGASACQADVRRLPLASAAFDAVSADRVMQHVDDPRASLREMVRVVRPGGRVVIADPDQGSLSIVLLGVRQALVDRIVALRSDVGYRNGRLIGSVPKLLGELGVIDIVVEPFPLTLTDPDVAFGLPNWPVVWREEGGFTDADLGEWQVGVARARDGAEAGAGGFRYSLTYVVVAGTVA